MFLFWSVFSAFMAILYLPLQVFPLPTAPEQRATAGQFCSRCNGPGQKWGRLCGEKSYTLHFIRATDLEGKVLTHMLFFGFWVLDYWHTEELNHPHSPILDPVTHKQELY